MEGEARRRGLECDCGYVAHGDDDDELVAAVQAHAREVHGMTLSAELVLSLAGTSGETFRLLAEHRAPADPATPPRARRLPR